MTIRRNERRMFDVSEARLTEAVREILCEEGIYRDVGESEDGFTATVRPNITFFKTPMRVRVEAGVESTSALDVTMVSQSFTYADPFGVYDRYLRDFLDSVEGRLLGSGASGSALWYRRWTIVNVAVVALMFTILPLVLFLFGLTWLALGVLFYPPGMAVGFGLVYACRKIRRRVGVVVAALAGVLGFVAAFAAFIAVEILVVARFLEERASLPLGFGIGFGVVFGVFMFARPEGFDGEVFEGRDVRGLRGVGLGIRRWIFGGPMLRGNVAFFSLLTLTGAVIFALSAFAMFRGGVNTVLLPLMALGLGNISLGVGETIPLPSNRMNMVLRIAGLACMISLPAMAFMSF